MAREKIVKYNEEVVNLIQCAELAELDKKQELASLLGVSKTVLQRSTASDYRLKDVIQNTKNDIKVKFVKALMKMAEGYYVEHERGKYMEGKKVATGYERKWIPGDPKIAKLLIEVVNPNTALADKPKVVRHETINITLNGKSLPEQKMKIKPDYVIE